MLTAITHAVPPCINQCELSFIDRVFIDYDKAVKQHNEYLDALARCGLNVIELAANLDFPDACFVEDTAIVVDEIAVITRPGAASRRGETEAIERELKKYRETARISSLATLEGGDVLRTGKRIFVGLSRRTSAQGITELARILRPFDYSVTSVEMRGCLHLKSACTALDDHTLLANTEAIDLSQFEDFRIVSVAEGEREAANSLAVGDVILLAEGFPRTRESIERLGFKVQALDISEFLKAEAGLTCSSLIFETGDYNVAQMREQDVDKTG
ncbi:MAG: arginine deiminase family protein [Acidobacteriota bacterium]